MSSLLVPGWFVFCSQSWLKERKENTRFTPNAFQTLRFFCSGQDIKANWQKLRPPRFEDCFIHSLFHTLTFSHWRPLVKREQNWAPHSWWSSPISKSVPSPPMSCGPSILQKPGNPGTGRSLPGTSPRGNYYLFPMVLDIVVEALIADTSFWWKKAMMLSASFEKILLMVSCWP